MKKLIFLLCGFSSLCGMESSVGRTHSVESPEIIRLVDCHFTAWVMQSLQGKIETSKLLRELREQKKYVEYDLLRELLQATAGSQNGKLTDFELAKKLTNAIGDLLSKAVRKREFTLKQPCAKHYDRSDVICALFSCVNSFDLKLYLAALKKKDLKIIQIIEHKCDILHAKNQNGLTVMEIVVLQIAKKLVWFKQWAGNGDHEKAKLYYDGMLKYLPAYERLKNLGIRGDTVLPNFEKTIDDFVYWIKRAEIDFELLFAEIEKQDGSHQSYNVERTE